MLYPLSYGRPPRTEVSDLSRIADLPTAAEIGALGDRCTTPTRGPEGSRAAPFFGHENAEESLM